MLSLGSGYEMKCDKLLCVVRDSFANVSDESGPMNIDSRVRGEFSHELKAASSRLTHARSTTPAPLPLLAWKTDCQDFWNQGTSREIIKTGCGFVLTKE